MSSLIFTNKVEFFFLIYYLTPRRMTSSKRMKTCKYCWQMPFHSLFLLYFFLFFFFWILSRIMSSELQWIWMHQHVWKAVEHEISCYIICHRRVKVCDNIESNIQLTTVVLDQDRWAEDRQYCHICVSNYNSIKD